MRDDPRHPAAGQAPRHDDQQLVAEGWGAHSVIAVSFEDDRNAYNALMSLKELASHKRVGVQEVVVVVHGEDGQVVEKDRVELQSMFLPNTAGGGRIGLLIGIIGGPLGMLIGSASGLCLGSLSDLGDVYETESALGVISSSVQVGRTALLAVVSELNPDVIDAAMSTSAAPCCADSWPTVEAEIAAAEDAERKAKWGARKELARSSAGARQGCCRREARRAESEAQPPPEGPGVRVGGAAGPFRSGPRPSAP